MFIWEKGGRDSIWPLNKDFKLSLKAQFNPEKKVKISTSRAFNSEQKIKRGLNN